MRYSHAPLLGIKWCCSGLAAAANRSARCEHTVSVRSIDKAGPSFENVSKTGIEVSCMVLLVLGKSAASL